MMPHASSSWDALAALQPRLVARRTLGRRLGDRAALAREQAVLLVAEGWGFMDKFPKHCVLLLDGVQHRLQAGALRFERDLSIAFIDVRVR